MMESTVLKNKDLQKLKDIQSTKRKFWTKQELSYLSQMKKNRISPAVFKTEKELLERLFPGRTLNALWNKYEDI